MTQKFLPGNINFALDRTQDTVVLRGGARLERGLEYAVRRYDYASPERAVFIGKFMEPQSCWNGKGEYCTYKGHLVFALEVPGSHNGRVETLWWPYEVSSKNIWGNWKPYEDSTKEQRKQEQEILKHNERVRQEVKEMFTKLGLEHRFPQIEHWFVSKTYKVNLDEAHHGSIRLSLKDLKALSERVKPLKK